jgi:hypothetical protein
MLTTGPAHNRRAFRVADPDGVAGGQGTVFRAEFLADGFAIDARPDMSVSLKQLGPVSQERMQALLDRAFSLSALRHPHLAQHLSTFLGPGLFDGDPPPDDECDSLYTAAEWAEGTSLQSLAQPMSVPLALGCLAQLASVVDYLHANDLTHRDLHPGNVIIDGDRLVVIDLGFTRPAGIAGVTAVHGAPGFVPPERFHDPSSSDVSADRWQVAMLGVYLLLGRARGRTPLPVLASELEGRLSGHVPDARQSARLLVRMLAEEPASRPQDPLVEWVDQIRGRRSVRTRRRWVAAALGLLLIAGAVTLGVVYADKNNADKNAMTAAPANKPVAAAKRPCPAARGVAAPALDAAHEALLVPLREQLKRVPAGVCARTPVSAFGAMLVQQMVGIKVGAVVATRANEAFTLTRAQWDSYHQTGGKDGREAPTLVGPITAVSVRDGLSEVRGTNGVLLAGRADDPHFWMPPQVESLWRSLGAGVGKLGLPTSNIQVRGQGLEQDFQRGYLMLPNLSSKLKIVYVDHPGALLPKTPLKGHILRQSDATAWYVNAQGKRQWIPNGGVYACLGADPVLMPGDVPGYAISTLEDAGPSYCGEGPDGAPLN